MQVWLLYSYSIWGRVQWSPHDQVIIAVSINVKSNESFAKSGTKLEPFDLTSWGLDLSPGRETIRAEINRSFHGICFWSTDGVVFGLAFGLVVILVEMP